MQVPTGQLLKNRYRVEGLLGTGTYGHVLRCVDITTREVVAVKVAHREAAYRRSALNEATVLKILSDSPSVIAIREMFEEEGRIHIVEEILYKNVYEVQRDMNFALISLDNVRQLAFTIMTALNDLHNVGYMHCDVKPENVMLRRPGSFEDGCLIDYGAVRKLHENMYYDVQSLWYRAPEVICGVPYTPAIDSWSVGCLLYEFHTGNPLFAGSNAQHQLSLLMEMFGAPSRDAMIHGKNSWSLDFSAMLTTGFSPRAKLEDSFRGDPIMVEQFADLLYMLLQPDEANRCSVADALKHPFMTGKGWMGPTCGPIPDSMNYSVGGLTQADPSEIFFGGGSPDRMTRTSTSLLEDDERSLGGSPGDTPKLTGKYRIATPQGPKPIGLCV